MARRDPAARPGWRAALGFALAAACTIASGCATHAPRALDAHSLLVARQFPFFRIYWAGPRFQDVSVSAADGLSDYVRSVGSGVYYGNCDRPPGVLHNGACVIPLEIQTAVYHTRCNRSLGRQRNVILRGVPATVFSGGDAIEIYTGRLAIDVYGDSPARTLDAARALRPLNAGGAPGTTLPVPVYVPGLFGPGARAAAGEAEARGAQIPPPPKVPPGAKPPTPPYKGCLQPTPPPPAAAAPAAGRPHLSHRRGHRRRI